MTKKSRLLRRLEIQTKRNMFFSILGIIVIFLVLIKFGVPLLVNFSLFISGGKNASSPVTKTGDVFVSSPILNSMPQATNSARILIQGTALKFATIDLYINESLVDKTTAKEDGTFSFEVNLSKGVNRISAKAQKGNVESTNSENFDILFKDTVPSLSVFAPIDGQSFSKDQNTLTVSGTSDSDTKVTVNDFRAIIDEKNNFSFLLPLKDGDNLIKIVAIDQAGNKIEKEIKVTYSP